MAAKKSKKTAKKAKSGFGTGKATVRKQAVTKGRAK